MHIIIDKDGNFFADNVPGQWSPDLEMATNYESGRDAHLKALQLDKELPDRSPILRMLKSALDSK